MERLLTDLLKQTQENSGLLQQALAELHELKQQVQNQKKFPFTVKTCGFEVLFFSKLNFIMLLIHPSLYASDPNSNMILVAHQDLAESIQFLLLPLSLLFSSIFRSLLLASSIARIIITIVNSNIMVTILLFFYHYFLIFLWYFM